MGCCLPGEPCCVPGPCHGMLWSSLVLQEPAVLEAVLGAGLTCRGVRQRRQGEIKCRGEEG